tara:strand:- start:1377 stop:4157 length:2781 start_codon:yes stop_codon:yes gene_type:complete
MAYQNLRFFDNTSNELNLTYNSSLGYLTGSSFLPEVSVGLYETLNLYVLEEVRDDLDNPRFVQPIGANTDSAKIIFEFLSDYSSSDDIFLYSGKIVENDFEVVVDKTQSSLMQSKTKYSGAIDSDGFKIIPLNMAALQPSSCIANIALSSSAEKFHIRTLIVSVEEDGVKTKVAEIKVYGETVGEDDRLRDLLTNMALNLDENDYLIFKDSDIKDLGVDYILLNEKRKELLLQASTIKPFIGTYKALLNVIDFFGYSNVSLREYWLNINEKAESFGKLVAVAVPNQTEVGFLAKKSRNTNLPSSNQKKTSRFSLAYRLNTPTGKLNEFDLPEVEEVSDFSPDEILIKLYALKRKLQREYLPLQAKIVDITGEGDYFDSVSQRTWSNQHQIHAQTAGQDVHYDILPEIKTIYLEDLRKVDYRLKGFKQDIRVFDKTNRNEIEESITKFYKSYHDEDMSSHNTIAGIPVGAPIVLRATSLKDTWDDAEFTFIDANDTDSDANVLHSNGQSILQDPYLTWDDWWKRSVYEVEWIITGPRKFKKTIRGPIDEWYTLPLILPYSGEYSIDAAFWDLYNVRSISFNRKITVESKNIQIYGLYQKLTPELNWSDYKYKWNEAGSSWEYGRENLSKVEDSISTYYLSSDRANYLNDAEEGKEFSIVRRFADSNTLTGFNETTGPYRWKSLRKHTWKDGDSTSWNQTRIGPDLNSSFKLELAGSLNGSITISQIDTFTGLEIFETYTPTSTYPTTNTDFVAWENIKFELNSLNANQWPIFTKFNWNPVYVDTDNNITNGFNGADLCNYMLVVSKQANESYDFHNATTTSGTLSPSSFVKYQVYNPNFNDAYTIQDHDTISLLNHMTFSYDISEMPGIVSQKWKLINNSINKEDIYYDNQWLTYLFDEKGEYTVELELTDVNGNRNITKKNILTIK